LQSTHTVLVTYREHTSKSETFLAGFLLGLGLLVNPYLAPLFLFIWLSLNVLKAFRWREWMLVLLGMAVPFYFFTMIYFASTGTWFVFQMPDWSDFHFTWQVFGTDNTSRLFAILFGVFLFFALFSWLGRMRGNIMRVRKQRLVLMYLNLFLVAAGLVLSGYFAQGALYLFLIPVSLLSAFMLAHSNFKWLLELFFYGLLILFVLAKAFPVV
jgi:MFS family permease